MSKKPPLRNHVWEIDLTQLGHRGRWGTDVRPHNWEGLLFPLKLPSGYGVCPTANPCDTWQLSTFRTRVYVIENVNGDLKFSFPIKKCENLKFYFESDKDEDLKFPLGFFGASNLKFCITFDPSPNFKFLKPLWTLIKLQVWIHTRF